MSKHSEESTEIGVDYMKDARAIAVGENTPGCKKRDPIVVAENVTRSFGGINAVDVEYLEIPRHKITALMAPTALARPRSSTCSPGSTFRTPANGSSKVKASPASPPTRWRAWAWSAPSSSRRSWAS